MHICYIAHTAALALYICEKKKRFKSVNNFKLQIILSLFKLFFFFGMSIKPPPYYTLLNPPLPSVLVLPRVRIDNKIQIDHADCLQKLGKYAASLGGSPSFWIEVAVLDKLHYKNLNQQRPFHRFKRGMEVRRIVKRLKALALDKELERLYMTFWDAKT